MYEMVTGKVPFDADTPVSVALKHMQEEPEEPIEVNPNIPTAVNKIIMKALQKDSTLRYQTATDMLRDLRTALKNPEGDFVEELEYNETARTQKIDTSNYQKRENRKKENKFIAWLKAHKKLSIFIGIILLFAISLGGTMLVLGITNPPEVEMPNVVGMSREEAQKEIENAKLKFEVEKEEYDAEIPEGFVISQDPKYMERFNKVKEGSTVKVVISKGQEKTKVPKVVGMKKEEAIQAIEDANLKAEVIEETSKKVEEGYVISQETEADTEIAAGETIKIHVSTGTGIKQVTVVSVVGQDEATAKKTLEDLGLKVTITYADSTKDNGKVANQSIADGKVVDEGTAITLTVNKVAENKTVTVNINVKAITGGYTENTDGAENNTGNTSNVTTSKTVNIKVNGETRTGVSKNETNCSVSLTGKEGEATTVTVTITDPTTGSTIYSSSKPLTFGTQDSLSFS